MSYGLLWIEMLLGVFLLYAGMLIAVGMRHKKAPVVDGSMCVQE